MIKLKTAHTERDNYTHLENEPVCLYVCERGRGRERL